MTDTCNYMMYRIDPNKPCVSLLLTILSPTHLVFHRRNAFFSSSSSVVKDVVLWRRKSLTATILIAATTAWTLMHVYQFHFVALFSWLVMLVLASAFLRANMLKSFWQGTPEPVEFGSVRRISSKNGVRGSSMDRRRNKVTIPGERTRRLFYIGTLSSTTVPVIYNKNQNRIKSSVEWLRVKCKRAYEIFDERAIQKIKRRVIINDENEMKRANEKKAQ